MRKIFVRRERNQQLYQVLKYMTYLNRLLAELFYYIFVIYILIKLKEFQVTQNETPKIVKIFCLY